MGSSEVDLIIVRYLQIEFLLWTVYEKVRLGDEVLGDKRFFSSRRCTFKEARSAPEAHMGHARGALQLDFLNFKHSVH